MPLVVYASREKIPGFSGDFFCIKIFLSFLSWKKHGKMQKNDRNLVGMEN